MQLRPYQQAAVDSVYEHLRTRSDNPCVVIPTGGGKSPVMAAICRDAVLQWSGRVLLLAHVKELLEQNADKIRRMCPGVPVGMHSAGLGRRDVEEPVIVAGIQSVYKRAADLGAFDLILVDEAHLISPDGEGMYRTFLADSKILNPNVRIIGLTATPYRLKTGMLCTPEHFLNHVCYEIGVRELILDGYLSPLISKAGLAKADTSGVRVQAGEFVASELEAVMDTDNLVAAACREVVKLTEARKSVLIFATGVMHGRHIQDVLQKTHNVECGFVCGETPDDERRELLSRFRGEQSGLFPVRPLKYLCNVNVLTTGFDAPNVDCVVLLRPTMSPGLYYQMVGRAFRIAPEKKNALVLDFGNNILRHGPVDAVQVGVKNPDGSPVCKECPICHAVIAVGFTVCPECNYEWPEKAPPERKKHDAAASDEGILTGQHTDRVCEVQQVFYSLHHKKGADEHTPRTMRVDYQLGLNDIQSEWICFEHDGFARQKAEAWWQLRSNDPIPDDSEAAVDAARAGSLAQTLEIIVRHKSGEKFDRVVKYKLGPKPDGVQDDEAVLAVDDDEVPF